ncbi:TetR/AcrR family transcriptional regulator [Micromonospora sp. WMMD712]|uniref:TetR/AcrR family transcriptional regulator n=1 Tax=Micromonospora sp. WMMD712 TaxID=3016096 RepID=UPI00249BB8CC|nr:TetR/AcrR family transcriptional regulator [Micromonospora sp. WMMD712]WFE60543.1 TetR/AcrR family transcriptional regulator [Micromonospora sp. WMMD712]
MTSADSKGETVATRSRRGRGDKAAAIAHAACEVFGRDGYTRASIDTIAAEAGASTRTLYNHFPGGKAELFRSVMQWSAGQVRDEQLVRLRRCLDPQRPPRPEDLERDLLALARAWVALITDFRDHFSLVRHIHGEAGHVPAEVLDAWQEAGPRTVAREFALVMAALADHGLLDVHDDPAQAVSHFMALISTEIVNRSYWGVIPLPREETDRITAVGVQAFLRAYGPAR